MAAKRTTTKRVPVRVGYPDGGAKKVVVDYPGQYGTQDGWAGDRQRGVAELDVASPRPAPKAAPVRVRGEAASKVRASLVAAKRKRPRNAALEKKKR